MADIEMRIAKAEAKEYVKAALLTQPCPQCGGPHSLSQCPNWRQSSILATHRYDTASAEAQFHRRIRGSFTKRQQGYIMHAFREVFSQPQQPTESQP